MKDFTLQTYSKLLQALQNAKYDFYTFEEYCDGNPTGKYVILRHDVDLKAENSLVVAKLEASLGIKASYYFRANTKKKQEETIRSIVDLGHEVGYHYNELSTFRGNFIKSIEHFEKQLEYFRRFYPVRTICMHGSPISRYDNRDLWKKYDYRNYGIVGEPYFDFLSFVFFKRADGVLYFTDTARMWDGDKYNIRDKIVDRSDEGVSTKSAEPPSSSSSSSSEVIGPGEIIHTTFDLINLLKANSAGNPMMITTHPQRWTDNKCEWLFELLFQSVKNKIKQLLLKFR